MGKRTQAARRAAATTSTAVEDLPVVGMREPCPCGSGKRYKACHGKQAHRAVAAPAPTRPFAGLAGEVELVAMREVLSAATAPLTLVAGTGPTTEGADVELVTLLPLGAAALVRGDGTVWLAAQTLGPSSGDASRDLGHALEVALAAEPGTVVELAEAPERAGARLQDLLDPQAPVEVSVHDTFDFWTAGAETDDDASASLARANEAVIPTARLAGLPGAYWCQLPGRDQVRWVLPQDEDPLLDALARLHAAGESSLGEGTRPLGTFRALGLLIPVWDLVPGTTAVDAEEPAIAFAKRLEEALAATAPLTAAERGARAGLANRQVTVR